jgi:rfaE bifunctional protein nucleotidyltransferase chain/domain
MPDKKENQDVPHIRDVWEYIYELDDKEDEEWIAEMRQKYNLPEVSQVVESTQKIAWVNGSFDVLHAGHIELFKYAKSVCDYLVVGTDTDERIRELKGESRPINQQKHRIAMLEAIRYIDKVVTFGSVEEQLARIRESNAEIIVIGSDYIGKRVVGEEIVKTVDYFNRVDGLSTTKIVG